MSGKLIPKRLLFLLLGITVILVLTGCAVLSLGAILGAMGDETGSRVLRWIAAGVGVALAVDFTCLIMALTLHAIEKSDEPPDES
jgi:Na+-translocating ferredoxin:NAD+ oxidoreductase RnfA subunit